jgi:glycosyltransferase involved in cell wall biosynthesis
MKYETMDAIYAEHRGKVSDKWASYLREYQRAFAPIQQMPVRLLEIGVQNGGSLELWARWFPNAQRIVGCDIDPRCASLTFSDPRIAFVLGNASEEETERAIAAVEATFDVVIDDGSHSSGDIIRSFARYFPRVADGGTYVIEDLHCAYWNEYEGGLHHPFSSMAFLKRLADVVNHEHWGVPKARADILRSMCTHFGVNVLEDALARVHSVKFLNSMCIVRKGAPSENTLGDRRVAGLEARIKTDLRGADNAVVPLPPPDETRNAWSASPNLPEEELVSRRAEVEGLKARIGQLERTVLEREQQLAHQLVVHQQVVDDLQLQMQARDERLVALERANAQERLDWQLAVSARDRELAESVAVMNELVGTRLREQQQAAAERDRLRHRNRQLESDLGKFRQELKTMQGSLSWRLTKPMRGSIIDHLPKGPVSTAARRVRKVLRQKGITGATERALELVTGRGALGNSEGKYQAKGNGLHRPPRVHTLKQQNYGDWIRQHDLLSKEEGVGLVARSLAFRHKPLISVVLPTYNPKLAWLQEAVRSVQRQVYPFWELCIVDDGSSNPDVRPFLERLETEDPRIRVKFRPQNGHISLATNTGIEMASGEWITFLDHDDIMREQALFWVVEALNTRDDLRIIFSDEDKLDERGQRCTPYFKSDFNEDLFLSYNMVCHLAVYRTDLVRAAGGCRQGFEGAQDYDLALRCVEQIERHEIHHVPRVLYSWRIHAASTAGSGETKPYAALAGQRALDEHFQRQGIRASAEVLPGPTYRVRYALPSPEPMVSIIIPTRNGEDFVRQCIESLVRRTYYDNYEILLVDNGSTDLSALKYFEQLASDDIVRLVRDPRPFNYSALNNDAVKLARGEFVCLMNNDIEVIKADWLSEMVSIAAQERVGAVGARLWYPNRTLQHAGVIVGCDGVATHAHRGLGLGDSGYFARAALIQTMSAVTAACLVIRKATYEQVGGLNERDLKVAFNDVDFCLRLGEAGYRTVWTPFAELIHHESATRGTENTPEKQARLTAEADYMYARWSDVLRQDSAYSPNLAKSSDSFAWAWPSRVPKFSAP